MWDRRYDRIEEDKQRGKEEKGDNGREAVEYLKQDDMQDRKRWNQGRKCKAFK